MLSLDSDRWSQLRHAYGPAADTPDLLRKLYQSPDSDTWADLIGSVIHQGDVSDAAYAAMPHVIAAAESVPLEQRLEYLVFAAAVVDGLVRKRCPDDLKHGYEAAKDRTRKMAMELLNGVRLSDQEVPYLFETIAAVNNLPTLARILEQFVNEEFTFDCMGCSSLLYVWTGQVPFDTYDEDPVSHPGTVPVQIQAPVAPVAVADAPTEGSDALPWLCWLSAAQSNQRFREKLISLYGDGACPRCGRNFNLFDELERAEREAEAEFRDKGSLGTQ